MKGETATLFLFFDPECEMCVQELTIINAQKADFSEFQIIFFTIENAETVHSFFSEINFLPSENMLVLFDEKADFFAKMQVRSTPTAFIYNKKGILTKKIKGMVKTETLIKYLSQ